MKHIAVRQDGEYRDDRAVDEPTYLQAYSDLANVLEKKGALLYLTKEDTYYAGGNRFTRGWLWTNGTFKDTRGNFDSDVIFCKDTSFQATPDANVLNRKEFDDLCRDKMNIVELFPELCPRTHLVRSADEVQEVIKEMRTEKIVMKPIDSYGGEGVFIGAREEAARRLTRFPYIVQEFIDSSAGIPGLTSTYHDLRFIIMNGSIAFSFLRIPRKGTLISNVALGGWMMHVPAHLRPPDALALCSAVDRVLSRFPMRMYCVDCARHSDGTWKLIELNAPPGQQTRLECGTEADEYFEKHAEFLLQGAHASSWKMVA